MKKALIKFNGGNPVILCSKCRTIIKYAKDFTEEETKFSRGEGKLESQFCNQCIVYDYPTKNKEGFTRQEQEDILKKHFPSISPDQYNIKLGVHTAMLKNGETITYHTDVALAIRCCLQNRNPTIFEWD